MRTTLTCLAALVMVVPTFLRADVNPDFERDAKPILAHQPGLATYIHQHYVVKETGIARVPGDGAQAPQPPYIFSARPRTVTGPFYLRLLIQPGSAGHILKVADIRRLPPGTPMPSPAPERPETADSTPPSNPPPDRAPIVSNHVIGTSIPDAAPEPSNTPAAPDPSAPSGPVRD